MDSTQTEKKVEARRCTDAIRDLVGAFRGRFEDEIRGTGVTLAQLRMLKAISGQREMSSAAIARECHVTPQTLHTMLARAAREGWIVRGTTDRNHRLVTAALTAKGERVVQQGTALREKLEAEAWGHLPEASLHLVRDVLEQAVRRLAPRDKHGHAAS